MDRQLVFDIEIDGFHCRGVRKVNEILLFCELVPVYKAMHDSDTTEMRYSASTYLDLCRRTEQRDTLSSRGVRLLVIP
jgi:hypothetical protein